MADHDDRPFETDIGGFGRTFPHRYSADGHRMFGTQLLVSPAGDRLVSDFGKTIIENEGLGSDDIPDYLSLSFSGVDAINHFFGPSSLENEDVVLHLDQILADFFAYVDETVGLDRTLIVLSADHGMPEAPEFMNDLGAQVQRINSLKLQEMIGTFVREEFGLKGAVRAFYRPYLYLNHKKIAEAGLDQEVVERAIAEKLMTHPGIALAVSHEMLNDNVNHGSVEAIRRNTHVHRSGDIYVLQKPYWYMQEGRAIAVMHGTPWTFDTHVPIIVVAPDGNAEHVHRLVHPVSVAPTIATYLGLKPPPAAMAAPLVEALP